MLYKSLLKYGWTPAILMIPSQVLATSSNDPATFSATGALIKTSGMLLLVLAIIYLMAWLLKKQQLPGHTNSRDLNLIESLPLGKNERLCLVKAGDRYLLLGVSANSVNQIGEIPAEQISNPTPAANSWQWAQQFLNRK